ncbi:MAG: Uma2 family endonuclease [Saprospiraceae bacterium]|nr:Uma2 family endonuclease [Saprospiraceae bacterium]
MTVLIGDKKVRIRNPKLLTYDDYVKLTPPDSGNYELHNGKILFMATPNATHQTISMNLSAHIWQYIRPRQLGKVLAAPMDTVFTQHDVLQPDLLFVSKEREDIIQKVVQGVPDLVVEIKSQGNSSAEMSYKKYIYESTGVREYWYILPEKQQVIQYENIDNELIRIKVLEIDDTLKSIVIEGFELAIKDIFE